MVLYKDSSSFVYKMGEWSSSLHYKTDWTPTEALCTSLDIHDLAIQVHFWMPASAECCFGCLEAILLSSPTAVATLTSNVQGCGKRTHTIYPVPVFWVRLEGIVVWICQLTSSGCTNRFGIETGNHGRCPFIKIPSIPTPFLFPEGPLPPPKIQRPSPLNILPHPLPSVLCLSVHWQ